MRVNVIFAAVISAWAPIGVAYAVDRDEARILERRIEGVGIDYSTERAWNNLVRQGFTPGVETFEDWWQDGLMFTKGERNSPQGETTLNVFRDGDNVIHILSQTFRPQNPFDPEEELQEVMDFFAITEQDPTCTATELSANCGVQNSEKTTHYLMTVHSRTMKYEVLREPGIPKGLEPPVDDGSPSSAELEWIDPPPPQRRRMEACSLTAMQNSMHPLIPELEDDKRTASAEIQARNRVHRTLTPDHYTENVLTSRFPTFSTAGLSGYLAPWCASTLAVADVEPKIERGALGAVSTFGAIVDRHMDELTESSGLTEAQIRQILIGDDRPAGVTDEEVRRLYDKAVEISQRELELENPAGSILSNRSLLLFQLFSPNLMTDAIGFLPGGQDLHNPATVATRFTGEPRVTMPGDWPSNTAANLLIAISREDAPPVVGEPGGHAVFRNMGVGVSYPVFAYADPINADLRIDDHPSTVALETINGFFESYEGRFGRYACNGEERIGFSGVQYMMDGYTSGMFTVVSFPTPEDPFLTGDLSIESGTGFSVDVYNPIFTTERRYDVLATDNENCPFEETVSEQALDGATGVWLSGGMRIEGRVRIPIGNASTPLLPGVRGRPIRFE